ncbi:MAG: hypothetical protein ABIH90_01185 [Candidatus Aenigmatarchaeota archaeon]
MPTITERGLRRHLGELMVARRHSEDYSGITGTLINSSGVFYVNPLDMEEATHTLENGELVSLMDHRDRHRDYRIDI